MPRNKRISEEPLSDEDKKIKKAKGISKKPSYMVTIPVKVNAVKKSDTETSDGTSGNDTDDSLSGQTFEIKTMRGQLHARDDIKVKDDLSDCEDEAINHVLSCFSHEETERFAFSFGLNTMYSLSKTNNKANERAMQKPIKTPMAVAQTGFFWEPRWQKITNGKSPKSVSWEEAHQYYRRLKYRNKKQAKKFLEREEKNLSFNRIVPYREIREKLKNHDNTKQLVRGLRNRYSEVYLNVCDPDLVSLNAGEMNTYECYDTLIQERQAKGQTLEVASVGYKLAPDNPGHATRQALIALAAELDLWVRNETAKSFPRVYYPETNSIVRVLPNQDTVTEKFTAGRGDYCIAQEMEVLIDNVIKERNLTQESMAFDARGAVATTMPARMDSDKLHARRNGDGLIVRWTLHQFKILRSTSQSHFHSLAWANSIRKNCPELADLKLPKKTVSTMLNSLIARLFKAYDVISFFEKTFDGESINFQQKFIEKLEQPLEPYIPKREKEAGGTKEAIERWEKLNAITAVAELKVEINKFFIGAQDIAQKIETAAIAANIKVVSLLKENLCCNFADLSKQLLLDSMATLQNYEESERAEDVEYNAIEQAILDNDLISNGKLKKEYKEILASLADYEQYGIYDTHPMHWAAIMGNIPLIKVFLQQTDPKLKWLASPNAIADGNIYPLHLAISYCADNGVDIELLRLFCNKEAVEAEVEMQVTAIYLALTTLEAPEAFLAMMLAHTTCSESLKGQLLDFAKKVSLDFRKLPLVAAMNHFPMSDERTQLIKFLIQEGAEVDQVGSAIDSDNTCALCEAIAQNDLGVVELLLENEADINTKSEYQESPVIMHAVYTLGDDAIEMIKLLVRRGAKINEPDEQENYPIHEAIVKNYKALAKFLIEHPKVDITQADGAGETPYKLAMEFNNDEALSLLTDYLSESDVDDIDRDKIREITGAPFYSAVDRRSESIRTKAALKAKVSNGLFSSNSNSSEEEASSSEESQASSLANESDSVDESESNQTDCSSDESHSAGESDSSEQSGSDNGSSGDVFDTGSNHSHIYHSDDSNDIIDACVDLSIERCVRRMR